MAHAYTPGLRVTGLTALRKERILPLKGEVLAHGDLVPDDMVRAFVICGTQDAVRAKVERAWSVADSLVLLPPAYGIGPERVLAHMGAIAELFYQ